MPRRKAAFWSAGLVVVPAVAFGLLPGYNGRLLSAPRAISPVRLASMQTSAATRAPYRAKAPVVTIDGRRLGPTFQGVGAVSGGGGNSRLLIDYPPAERSAILDYLFKPHYGASLQLLKLEIGGDGNSSDGSEPTVEAAPGRVDCQVGYEFWLAKQAVALDPSITLYGLQWSAPSFVRSSTGGLWTMADIHYIVTWLGCARQLGLRISYIGGWNEHYSPTPAIEQWYISLRQVLDQTGFATVKIVAADANSPNVDKTWAVAADMAQNPALDRAVAVIGVHDVCGRKGYSCTSTAPARRISSTQGKPLWQAELGLTPSAQADPAQPGPGSVARSLNNGYIRAGLTATLLWPLMDSMAPSLPFENRGLVTADSPWSGNYKVEPLAWVVAQTTQFTAPGWRFVAGANGYLDGGGSFVTYESPTHSAWSMVLQTSVAAKSQWLTVRVIGGLPAHRVHVWCTSLKGSASSSEFRQQADLAVTDSRFSYQLAPGGLCTFTTTTGQSKDGGVTPRVPAASAMLTRYSAQPDGAGMARMLSPMEGAFQYVHGTLTQTAVGAPVSWEKRSPARCPYAVVGGSRWTDYTVSVQAELPQVPVAPGSPTGAILIARFEGYRPAPGVAHFNGYVLSINAEGQWAILRNGTVPLVRLSGRVRPSDRYTLSFTATGDRLWASIDGALVGSVIDRTYRYGLAGLGSLGYNTVRYKGFTVRPER
ncbi:MAG: glycoside hydrolase family 30 protein [Acidimicrobiales bacterium]